MTRYTSNDKLLIHCFQDSLTGSTTKWYNLLSRDQIKSWTDLAKALKAPYYDQIKWRDLAAQVQPLMTDKKLNKMFLNTLKAPYYDRMIENSNTNFSDMQSP